MVIRVDYTDAKGFLLALLQGTFSLNMVQGLQMNKVFKWISVLFLYKTYILGTSQGQLAKVDLKLSWNKLQ